MNYITTRFCGVVIAAFAFLLGTSTTLAAPVAYQFMALSTFSGGPATASRLGKAVNNTGQAIGSGDRYENNHYVGEQAIAWYDPSTGTYLGKLAGESDGYSLGSALGINNAGTVVGSVWDLVSGFSGFGNSAVIWQPGSSTPTRLPAPTTLGDVITGANSINDNGMIVGAAFNASNQAPLVWSSSAATPTTLPGTTDGAVPIIAHAAIAVNNAGQVVGYGDWTGEIQTFTSRAMAWRADGQSVLLARPTNSTGQNSFSGATAISQNGMISGFSTVIDAQGHFVAEQGLRWSSLDANPQILEYVNLHLAQQTRNEALGINSDGLVVGEAFAFGNGGQFLGAHAVLWDQLGNAIDLNDITQGLGNLTLMTANGISDSGYIVGTALTPEGTSVAFLLQPVPEPCSMVLACLAAISLACARCARWPT